MICEGRGTQANLDFDPSVDLRVFRGGAQAEKQQEGISIVDQEEIDGAKGCSKNAVSLVCC